MPNGGNYDQYGNWIPDTGNTQSGSTGTGPQGNTGPGGNPANPQASGFSPDVNGLSQNYGRGPGNERGTDQNTTLMDPNSPPGPNNPYIPNDPAFQYGQTASGAYDREALMGGNAAGVEGRGGVRIDPNAYSMMAQAAAGKTPSAAEIQQGRGIGAAMGAQLAAANSARGGPQSMAAAQGSAAAQGGAMQTQAVGQAAQLRAQEMATARGQYGQMAQAQAQADIQQRAQNDAMSQFYTGQQSDIYTQQDQAFANARGGSNQIGIAQQPYSAIPMSQLVSGATSAAGAGMTGGPTGSDIRMKEDPKPETPGAPQTGVMGQMYGGLPQQNTQPQTSTQMPPQANTMSRFMSDERAKEEAKQQGAKEALQYAALHPDLNPYVQKPDLRGTTTRPESGGAQPTSVPRTAMAPRPQAAPPPREPEGPTKFGTTARPGQEMGGGVPVGPWPRQAPKPPEKPEPWQRPGPELFSSDEKGKSGKESTIAHAFLDSLHGGYSYKYKDPSNEPSVEPTGGRYLGVMAQDLERVPEVGPQLVKNTPKGKYLEEKALVSALAAGEGNMHERLKRVERLIAGKR
jgi:hypothetical protein